MALIKIVLEHVHVEFSQHHISFEAVLIWGPAWVVKDRKYLIAPVPDHEALLRISLSGMRSVLDAVDEACLETQYRDGGSGLFAHRIQNIRVIVAKG